MKTLIFNTEATDALKAGVDALADAVKVTLGPMGRNVVIENHYGPHSITKDGVSVAMSIHLEDDLENLGAQLVKEVASKTAYLAGDGTTTATVLAQAILNAGLKNVAAGANPIDLKRGIDKAVEAVVKFIMSSSQKTGENFEKIEQIATISANNDKFMGSLIAGAMRRVTKDGLITVEPSNSTSTYVDVVDGMKIDSGYINPNFVNNPKKRIVDFVNPYILLYDKKINSFKDLVPLFTEFFKEGEGRPMLIVAEDVEGEALGTIIVNTIKGHMQLAAIKAPGYGVERRLILDDIGVATGAKLISTDRGLKLEATTLADLGRADRVIIDEESTTFIGGGGEPRAIASRVNVLKEQIKEEKDDAEKARLKERLARISGGVAVLYVGGGSELEVKEKRDRIDDALHATRAAVEEGIVPGGGVAFIRALRALDKVSYKNEDEKTGGNIIRKALEAPLRQIAENAGVDGSIVVAKVREGRGGYGYNAKIDKYQNLVSCGVIDPAKVTRVALENAASISGLLLTTACVVMVKRKPNG